MLLTLLGSGGGGGGGAASVVQSVQQSGLAPITLTGVTAGNALVCSIATDAPVRATSITDSSGASWGAPKVHYAGGVCRIIVYVLENAGAGTHTITASIDINGGAVLELIEVGGVTTTPYDSAVSGTNVGTPSSNVVSGTPSQADELLLTFMTPETGGVITASASSGWTLVQHELDNGAYYGQSVYSKAISAATPETATWTMSATGDNMVMAIIGLKAAGGGAAALQATPAAVATATAALSTAIQLASSAAGVATASGTLSGGAAVLAATPSAIATATAALSTSIRLLANPSGQASSTAALTTTPSGLSANAQAQATTTAALTTAIQLAAAPSATASSTADLTAGTGGAALAAQPAAQASASAALATSIRLAAQAAAEATATASLTAGSAPAVDTGNGGGPDPEERTQGLSRRPRPLAEAMPWDREAEPETVQESDTPTVLAAVVPRATGADRELLALGVQPLLAAQIARQALEDQQALQDAAAQGVLQAMQLQAMADEAMRRQEEELILLLLLTN